MQREHEAAQSGCVLGPADLIRQARGRRVSLLLSLVTGDRDAASYGAWLSAVAAVCRSLRL
jgi:hypothetical protein